MKLARANNDVLDALDHEHLDAFLLHCKDVPLRRGELLYEVGQEPTSVCFPTSGVVSILADLGAGVTVETATVGREGFVGISVFLGAGPPTERAQVQVSGRAHQIEAGQFRQELLVLDGPLQAVLRRYTQVLCTQLARNAACNRVHTVRQRAARWLLMTADRTDSPTFELTQDSLADMLAVRRASVSEVAAALAAEGCISYRAGSITVLDRNGLQVNACDCYGVIMNAGRAALAAH